MPYIRKERRELLDDGAPPKNAGELNYLITEECRMYMTDQPDSYKTRNEIVGVLECAKLEFYRRKVAPYEDIKIKENGDVY